MPYKIIWEENGVVIQFTGIFDCEVNKNANCELYENPRVESINYVIWDASGISESLITDCDVGILSMQDHIASSRVIGLKLALLAKDKQTLRLFENYTHNYHSRLTNWYFMVSESMKKIRKWTAS